MQREQLIKMLSSKRQAKRLKAIKLLKRLEQEDNSLIPETVENSGLLSVHTDYSFSPFSPSLAAYMAYKSGLACAGITDHDTLSGAIEFEKTAQILGMQCATSLQLRARFYKGKGRWLNNFYEKDIGFVSIRGIPSNHIAEMEKYLAEVRKKRAQRGKLMVEKFNNRLKKYGITLNFDKDVKPLSRFSEGGTITERHILFAFAEKLIKKFASASAIVEFIKDTLKINIEEEYMLTLSDIKNPYFAYDLVSCLKREVRFFYVPATDAPDVEEVVDFAHKHGALITYMYIGVDYRYYEGEEIAITLEDSYIADLIKYLASLGFDAVELPNYITEDRAAFVTGLVEQNGMFTLSYSDINSPRQRFAPATVCGADTLSRNMWAVVGHEKSVEYDISDGLNTEKSKAKNPNADVRLKLYAEIGKLTMR